MAEGEEVSRLNQISGPSHGNIWKLQKYLWLFLFTAFMAVVGLSSYKPMSAMGSDIPTHFLIFASVFALANILMTLHHKLEGHNKRFSHSLVGFGALIVVSVGGAILLLVSIGGLTVTSMASNLAFLSLLPYYLLAVGLTIGVVTSTLFYENIEKLSILIPVAFIILTLVLTAHHYVEVGSAVTQLNSYEVSEPYSQDLYEYEERLLDTRTHLPPINKISVAVAVTAQVSLQNIRTTSDLSYVNEDCIDRWSDSADQGLYITESVLRVWNGQLKTLEANQDLIVSARLENCGEECDFSQQQIENSLEEFRELEEARLDQTIEILNGEKADINNVEACELERSDPVDINPN